MKKYAWALAFLAFAGTPLSLNVQEIAPIHISVAQAQTQDATKASTNIADFNEGAKSGQGCDSWFSSECVAAGLIQLIGRSALSVGSWCVWLTGLFFDKSIQLFVAEFGNYYELIKPLLTQMWGLVRDLCNLAFIFGFIYIGIKTIIDPDNASTKRFLSSIIIGAIFINFSLYLVQLIIDISNFLAVTIYNAIIGTSSVTIAGKIVGVLGLSTIWDSQLGSPLQSNLLNDPTLAFAFFTGSALFLLITAFILLAGALLILVRFIELILIMIFSPLIFGARVFPQTEPVSKKILGKLFSTAFFVPVYLFMLYISLQFAQKFSDAFAKGTAFNKVLLNEPGASTATVGILLVVNYIIIIFLLIQSLLLSLKIGATGAGMAISVGNNMKNRAQNGLNNTRKWGQRQAGNATAGAVGAAGRATIGRRMQKLVDSGKLQDAAGKGGWRGVMARQQLKAAKSLSGASFDARAIGGIGATLGIGEAAKGGYKAHMDAVKKKEEEYAKSLGVVGDDDTNVAIRKREMEHAERELKKNKGALQKRINGKDIADRETALKELETFEKAVKDGKTNYEKERNRRVVGSSFATETQEVKDQRTLIDAKKNTAKKLWSDHDAALKDIQKAETAIRDAQRRGDAVAEQQATNARNTAIQVRDQARKDIEDSKRQTKNAEERLTELLKTGSSDRGYAGVLENRGHIVSWITGRSAHQNHEAGKAVRKAGEKGFPKDKEDKH